MSGVTARRAWVIDLRRLGCGCGRRLVTGSCVIRETTQTGRPWSRPRVSLSISLSIYLSVYLSISPQLVTEQRLGLGLGLG